MEILFLENYFYVRYRHGEPVKLYWPPKFNNSYSFQTYATETSFCFKNDTPLTIITKWNTKISSNCPSKIGIVRLQDKKIVTINISEIEVI